MKRRLAASFVAVASVGFSAGCSQDPIEVSLRSLDRSGAVAFVCLGDPGTGNTVVARPLAACTAEEASGLDDFAQGEDDEGGELPHLYALVTQTTRGELAVIDLSSDAGNVLDQDATTPGPTFLPIGAQPIDIASTPGGTAAFVTTAELGRPAVYAIPTQRIRPCGVDPSRCGEPPPTLTSWPACSLPATPGEVVIAFDPATEGGTRASCDGAPPEPAGLNGDIGLEGRGRQKLVVALPTLGQLAVIDAQRLLDRAGGEIAPCEIERTVALSTDVPQPAGDPIPDGPACVVPTAEGPRVGGDFGSTPSGLWLAQDRLYVGDLTAPLVHVLEASTPCDLVELPPLLTTSREDPTRVAVTSRIAASDRLAPGFKRYVYAVDAEDRSLMVFDVSDDATSREPLLRPHAELNPLQPPDRLRFDAAPRDLIVVERDVPATIPASGAAPYGTRCDPDPAAVTCDATTASCDVGTIYRTSVDYEDGAGPFTLRGTFAFVALSDGQVAVIDIDDYDADCRGPSVPSALYGCDQEGGVPQVTTDEATCNVSVPHELRSAAYIITNDLVGRRQPGLATFPLLYRQDGTVVPDDDETAPRLRAVVPATPFLAPYDVLIGSEVFPIDGEGRIEDEEGVRHAVALNLEEPRVHRVDQEFRITYEGALPGLERRAGDLRMREDPPTFRDAAARFCEQGVQSEAAVREQLEATGLTGAEVDAQAPGLADRLVVTEELPGANDPWWERASCTFQECLGTFGDTSTPRSARDLPILEAYGDHLVLGASEASADSFECCFPTLVSFTVRAGQQWVVVGAESGFLHHVVADPTTGACRDSCDPLLALARGRILTSPTGAVVEGAPGAFRNPFFRAGITGDGSALTRDLTFLFQTQGQFVPLVASLTSETTNVLPQTLSYVPSTGELAIADGSLEGLMLISTRTMQLQRQYF